MSRGDRFAGELELEDASETGWPGNSCSELIHWIKKYGFEAMEGLKDSDILWILLGARVVKYGIISLI